MTLYSLVGRFAWRHRRAYAGAAVMLVIIAVLTVWIPRRIGHVIDGLVADRLSGAELAFELAILLAMGVAIYLLRVGWRIALFSAAFRLGIELRTSLYQRLTLQGPAFFHAQRTGDLMALATNDVDAVELAAGEACLAGFDGTLTLVLVVAMMTVGVDWRLGIVALLPFPLMALAFWRISREVHDAWRDSLDRFSELNEHVQETMAAVRTLRALGLEERVSADFARHAGRAAAQGLAAQKWEAAYGLVVGAPPTAATVFTLALGGLLVWRGELTIGTLTAFTMYLTQLIWPMFAAGWVLSLVERGKAAWERLQPVLRAPLSLADAGTRERAPDGELHGTGLAFAYPVPAGSGEAARLVLADVAFRLAPGRTLGIVGPTGAGKSTLLQLILRHHEPTAGCLEWGGEPLARFRLSTLRAALAWVPQEPFLFSASIAQNIALARADATREEIEHAARMADLHADVLRFPEGYDTLVGERGVTLSGGQRQRVAIARALLAQAQLLLLDDALSAVDTGTEARILGHLREVRGGRTAIIVSHRLSAVMDAQEILVLKDGRVAERGTHDALLAANGWYAAQWRYQQLEASLEAA